MSPLIFLLVGIVLGWYLRYLQEEHTAKQYEKHYTKQIQEVVKLTEKIKKIVEDL